MKILNMLELYYFEKIDFLYPSPFGRVFSVYRSPFHPHFRSMFIYACADTSHKLMTVQTLECLYVWTQTEERKPPH